MSKHGHVADRVALTLSIAALLCFCLTTPSRAYVDLAPTLAKIVGDSKQIALVEVQQYSSTHHTALLQPVRTLKGDPIAGPIRHLVAPAEGGPVPRPILQWAAPGARGVLFVSRNSALVCIGESWYPVHASGGGSSAPGAVTWRLGSDRPDLPLAYCGSVPRLATAIEQMLAGREAVITAVPHGGEAEAASFDLALNRFNIPGLIRVQRMRINPRMTGPAVTTSANPAYVLGQGPVDEADLPALVERLHSPDATVRADAAEDLRSLGRQALEAAPPLAGLLTDPSPRVRLSAASALLRITPKDKRPLDTLAQGLGDPDLSLRRDAAKATGLAGRAAAPLVEQLVGLLSDADEPTRVAAVQAIATLGPVAARAAPAVTPLLGNPDLMLDAADALGRIGPAVRPVPAQLLAMLSNPQKPVQWVAVRAISQIGGPEAKPAVEYMVKALPTASEVEQYNMMIYLSLIGPDAKDAEAAVRSTRIKNPMLPSSTLWAMAPEKRLPWQGGGGGPFGGRGGFGGPGGTGGPGGPGGFGGRGGPGGAGGGPGGFGGGPMNMVGAIYEAYVDELGTRLRPVAPVLARKIMDGTAGDVPDWGYRLLACGPEEALDVLTPYLAGADPVLRERAVAAIGRMGSAAAPAREKLAAALGKAPTAGEKRLIEWCLWKIGEEE